MLEHVKRCKNLEGTNFHDDRLMGYIRDVQMFLQDAGIPASVTESEICGGVVARGVDDLWSNDAGNVDFSPFFYKRAAQLASKEWGVTSEQT